MKDFIFRNDTKLLFRNNIRKTVSEIAKDHKAMLVYGGGSIKQNGCYEDIVRTLADSGIPFVEYGGSSREFEKIEQGIRVAKANFYFYPCLSLYLRIRYLTNTYPPNT